MSLPVVTTTSSPDTPTLTRTTIAGWHYSTEVLAAAVRGELLLNPSLDLSNACNLNCGYCFIEEKNSSRKVRHSRELTLAETLGVVKDFATAGSRTVNLVGAGEPSIDVNFERIIAEIAKLGMTPVVFTNGIRLAEDAGLVAFLREAGATVVLKYNALDHALQDLVAGRAGYGIQRDRALGRLMAEGFNRSTPTRLGLDTIAFERNFDELSQIHRWCRSQNIYPLIADFIPTGRTEGGQFVGIASAQHLPVPSQVELSRALKPLSSGRRRDLLAELAEIDEKEFGILRVGSSAYYGGGACTQALGVYVDILGNIWPCVARARVVQGALHSGLLGNVRNGDVPSKVWRSDPYMMQVRSTFSGTCAYKASLDDGSLGSGDSQLFQIQKGVG